MLPTRVLRAGHYQPLIKFIGKHHPPAELSHAPAPHPAAPTQSLPDSFAAYRAKAQSHGPLGRANGNTDVAHHAVFGQSQIAHGAIGGHSARELGSTVPGQGLVADRSELPKRFARLPMNEGEIEAIETGGATKIW